MVRYSAASMLAAQRAGAPKPQPAPSAKGGVHRVAIPKGGHAEVRSVDNGTIVSVRDANYRTVSESVAVGASQVTFDKK